jgi:hypothetical protein
MPINFSDLSNLNPPEILNGIYLFNTDLKVDNLAAIQNTQNQNHPSGTPLQWQGYDIYVSVDPGNSETLHLNLDIRKAKPSRV